MPPDIEAAPASATGSARESVVDSVGSSHDWKPRRLARGVMKMRVLKGIRPHGDLVLIYIGVYCISFLTSLEFNTTPTIDPYFMSELNKHSLLSLVAIVSTLGFAIGKPPMSMVLDMFGRPEGFAIATVIYSFGHLLTVFTPNALFFVFARAISAFGGEGIQLAQQILVADTVDLANRGLITSTISLPWLITTFLGPQLGNYFLKMGPTGYRAAYGLFGLVLPCVAIVLIMTLIWEWRRFAKNYERDPDRCITDIGDSYHSELRMQPHHDKRDYNAVAPRCGRSQCCRNSPAAGNANRLYPAGHPPEPSYERPVPHGLVYDPPAATLNDISAGPDTTFAADQSRHLINHLMTTPSVSMLSSNTDVDIKGTALFAVGLSLLLIPLTLSSPEGAVQSGLYLGIMALGAALLAYFWHYEKNIVKYPMMCPTVLLRKTVFMGSMIGCFHFISQFAYSAYFTSYLQVVGYSTPKDSSFISLLYLFSASFSAIFAGSLIKYSSRYRWTIVVGIIVHIAGSWILYANRNESGAFLVSRLTLAQVLAGVGGGFTTIGIQVGVQASVPHVDVGMATAIYLTITQVGGAFGAAVAGKIWISLLKERLYLYVPLEDAHAVPGIIASLATALSYAVGSPVRVAINHAYSDVMAILFAMSFVANIPNVVFVWYMENCDLSDRQDAQDEYSDNTSERSSLLN